MFSLSVASALALYTSSLLPTARAQSGQPDPTDSLNQFKIVGNSLVSAQQVFLGTVDKVYIVDKTEDNPAKINGHPAWGSEWSISGNTARTMDVITNSFCAGGTVLGNGTWMNVGGNQGVTYGGVTLTSGNGPYDDADGGKSVRILNPCDNDNCDWETLAQLTTRRWYPTLETLPDGSAIILGGDFFGGYVNSHVQNNPTYEFWPSKGAPVASPILANTLPANLYPLTFLLPSGNLLIQSNWATVLLDYTAQEEQALQDIPDAVRCYPASGGTAMLPLTPANNWTATILFCGGSNIKSNGWETPGFNIPQFAASASCVSITPDVSGNYTEEDPLPEGRSMGNLILLPDGTIWMGNGAATGTAGYGNTTYTVGQSYADNALLSPAIYNPAATKGSRWSRDGLSASTIPRMYHSSATLLPDGSVFVSGSNPNSDYNATAKFPTEYRVETFYPAYYNKPRPAPQNLPTTLTYGGAYWNLSLTSTDLAGTPGNIANTKVVVIRTGFSTHTINMGMRFVELDSSYTGNSDGSGTLHVAQLPPNAAILAPGPALLFVVVNGVPSLGQMIMVGSGKIGKQPTLSAATLPSNATATGAPTASSSSSGGGSSSSAAVKTDVRWAIGAVAATMMVAAASMF
ncbi:copper radical oxidase [Athelia psychrophila]|uniref:Copper radical oxidase n=1 Tax=Athelia psychrophila TaxID=1759441 RepID=A0A166IIU5_9AGAM|nr:copper radical oxidase [Fibularhizoctonia sp. CBS 109695]